MRSVTSVCKDAIQQRTMTFTQAAVVNVVVIIGHFIVKGRM